MDQVDNKLGKLTEESVKRKERLRRLRELSLKSEKSIASEKPLPKPIFRSYKPLDENTTGELLQQELTGEIETEVAAQLELLNTPMTIDEIDIANLAPRKADWDLKRDADKKLEKLERRTHKAIAELIRDRLKKNQDNICQVVNVGSATNMNMDAQTQENE